MNVVGEGSFGFELPEVEREKVRENIRPLPFEEESFRKRAKPGKAPSKTRLNQKNLKNRRR
jgi:hypothetical protein